MQPLAAMSVPVAPPGPAPETAAAALRHGGKRSVAHVARDFESMFVSLILKEMRQTLEPGAMFGEDNSDSYGSLFDMYMGQHIAKAGGFGIAEMVRHYLQASPQPGERPAPLDQAFDDRGVA